MTTKGNKMKITLTNSFHNTEASMTIPANGMISGSVVRRVRRELCGIKGCQCGGNFGERGGYVPEVVGVTEGGGLMVVMGGNGQ